MDTDTQRQVDTLLATHPRTGEVARELLRRFPTRDAAAQAAELMREKAYHDGRGGVLIACRFAAELIRLGWTPPF